MNSRPLIGLALLIASAAALTAGCGSSGIKADVTQATASEAAATDATAAGTPTNGATTAIGVGVDQTCKDLVGFFALAKDVEIARGGNSVSDVEKVAAAASELARNAPAEPSSSFMAGEPRESFAGVAKAYGTYLDVLSEGDLDPGPDALLDARVAGAMEDVSIDVSVGIVPWIDARCSAEVKDQLQQLGD
jgi:hypothetical protein